MDRRSTSAEYTHFGGDVTAQVNSSHGVRLSGGSTGGIVEAVGDDTNVSLRIRAQGAGNIIMGSATTPFALTTSSAAITSTHINLNSTRTSIGGSTTTFVGIRRVRVDFTVPALSTSGTAGSIVESSLTVAGLTTNSILTLQRRMAWNSTVPGVQVAPMCSTAGSLNLTFTNTAPTSLSGSTVSAYLLIHELPAAVP